MKALEEAGRVIANLSWLLGFVRGVFDPMKIKDGGMMKWFKTVEGEDALKRALTSLGSTYVEAIHTDSLRFKLIEDDTLFVNTAIPPKLPKYGDVIPVSNHRDTGESVEIKRIGEDLYVDGRKIILLEVNPLHVDGKLNDLVAILRSQNIDDKDAVSASILDALLEYRFDFIPNKWKKGDDGDSLSILFTGTLYGGKKMLKGYRTLQNGSDGWMSSFSPLGISHWESGDRIAILESLPAF